MRKGWLKAGDDLAADRQRGRGARARGVEDVQRAGLVHEIEILDECAIRPHRLGANPRSARREIRRTDIGHEAGQRLCEQRAAAGAAHLINAHPRVFRYESPQTGEGQRRPALGRPECQCRVWAGFDAAVNVPREMHAEKWEGWVRHRVNEIAHQVRSIGAQDEIFATERHDAYVDLGASLAGDLDGLETRAIDQQVALEGASGRLSYPTWVQGFDPRVENHAAAGFGDGFGEGATYRGVVDDPLFWHLDGRYRIDRGFQGPRLARAQPAEARQAVAGASFEQRPEARNLRVIGGDDEFAADLVRDAVRAAECRHLADAGYCQASLGGARRVVQARVQHAAIVTALLLGEIGVFFEDDRLGVRPELVDLIRGRESDDAAADDQDPRQCAPSIFSTTGIVRIRIATSFQIAHRRRYAVSSRITSSKSVMRLRPFTCHGPVMPGFMSKRE